ncbi:hypothetical protein HELRODRAFT_156024 [Helobdella robusta]|uniref:Dynein intermediate chain 3, ciliary n=1 Tax=Helobdella robusta TaxID=6412 RepID=T1ELQ8_HELRO|nr:hypothetical protein HELRODRAFT_156024 [Helobdella robusta]ESN96476.1 hypothetical protein HELRODRAFT_156024 [Helobdella robusta]
MEIMYVYSKRRSEFGRQCSFSDRPAELLCDIPVDPVLRSSFIDKNPVDVSIDCGPSYSEHEWGWPRDINPLEMEQVIRFRKKVEKEEGYLRSMADLSKRMEHCIKQNNAVDIYENFFEDPPYIDMFNKRSAVHITWYPDGPKKIAVAYRDDSFDEISEGGEDCPYLYSFIWDVENSNHPDFTLKPPFPLCCLEFSPKDSHLLIGGLENGQVALFDTRKNSRPCELTHIESCHRDRVTKILWIASKIGTECFSASVDGQVMWWDTRKLQEPLEYMCLDTAKRQNLKTADGALSIEYEATMPTKFMAGTEQGNVLTCNRKAKSVQERVSSVHVGHVGGVRAIQRNPFFLKNFLTVGDWTAKIWVDDHKDSAIWSSKYGQHYMTDACWSPTRAGVFLTSRSDGMMEVWDITHMHANSVLKVKVTEECLDSMRMYDNGQMVAVGSREGLVMLYNLNESLFLPDKNEKNIISNLFEREARREKLLESKHREFRTKERIKSSLGYAV